MTPVAAPAPPLGDQESALRHLSLALDLECAVVAEYDLVSQKLSFAGSNSDLKGRLPMRFGTSDHVHVDDRDRCQAIVQQALESGGRYRMEYRLATAGEDEIWISSVGEVVRDAQGVPIRMLSVMKDISESRRRSLQVERLAFSDALTGLSNRALFQREFAAAADVADRTGEALGLVMIDVDHFKDINDTLGHDAGDALLCALAEKLSRAFRQTDTVCRLGGDEFAIILRGLHSDAVRLHGRLRGPGPGAPAGRGHLGRRPEPDAPVAG